MVWKKKVVGMAESGLCFVAFYVNEEFLSRMKEEAKRKGCVSLSEFIRETIRKEIIDSQKTEEVKK